jgi:hypothetical protein
VLILAEVGTSAFRPRCLGVSAQQAGEDQGCVLLPEGLAVAKARCRKHATGQLGSWAAWLSPVTLATWEAEIRRIEV